MPPEVLSGTVIAGFRLGALIGQGAMGAVYLADDLTPRRRVALKVLAPDLTDDERFRQRFLREASIAATLDHPHIVPTLTFGEEEGRLYLAMAYVEGSDLRELLRREGALEPERTLRLIAQVAGALDAAHAAGLVHRDVKPGNILLAAGVAGEAAYVCDFGLARHVSSVSSLTGDRGFVGTIDYVSPEQITGGAIDHRADVYSLGCVLFECLAGVRPFAGESELAVVFAHLNESTPLLSDVRPELPEALDGVFATALAKSPDQRYSTCTELVEAAQAAVHGEALRPRRPPRRRYAVGALAVLAAAGASIGGVLATRGGSSAPPPSISQSAIAGAKLGLTADAYKQRFGSWRAQTLTEPDYPGFAFQDPKVAVYFPSKGARAIILTTWNRDYRTAKGVGPCSTLGQLKRAYGSEVRPSRWGMAGGKIWSYTVGKNLLFAVRPDTEVVAAVALYDGGAPRANAHGGAQAYANYVAQVEASCTP